MKKLILSAVCLSLILSCSTFASFASQINNPKTGVRGGLVVHIGCGDGIKTAGLLYNDSFVVYGLDTDAKKVAAARQYMAEKGLYGKVTIDTFDGKTIPLIDNMVNLLVAEKMISLSNPEILRVLAPGGIALVNRTGKWQRLSKPRSKAIDEWTHYHHDPAGTMVGKDELVGPPRKIQWIGDPKWLRNHEFMASMHAMVSSNGRIFYIMDEGQRKHIFLPSKWKLIARDAFNGAILWKRDINDWQTQIWPMKSGPGYMPRRIVSIGDTIYVTLGFSQPVTAIDAATGKTIRTYNQTKSTEEIIVADDVLYVLNDPDKQLTGYRETTTSWGNARNNANTGWAWKKDRPKRYVLAVDTKSGKTIWKHETNIAPLTLTVGEKRVYCFDGDNMIALDRATGDHVWSCPLNIKETMATGYAHRVVLSDGVLAFCHNGSVHAIDASTGKVLWDGKLHGTGHNSPNDMFIINGLVWSAATGKKQTQGTPIKALDLHTGEIKHDFIAENPEVYFMHQRCYPGRATEKFLITSGTGTEFYEIGGPEVMDLHHYVRGSCIYGMMPANGLLYKPADSCACYYQSKLTFMMALAAGTSTVQVPTPDAQRLTKGPAYGAKLASIGNQKDNWTNYRHDPARSGSAAGQVPSKLKQKWKIDLGAKLTAMTVADGKAFVAAVDQHKLYALKTANGKTSWTFTAAGRIDSPPTIYKGLAIFGSADGSVYCLKASDGALVWKYQAAPGKQKLLCRQQIESLWPVNGSVLVRDDIAYCLAGRNMFFDGGMRLLRLDIATGEKLSETILNEIDPETGDSIQVKMPGKAMPVANPDILSCDDKFIYMGAQKFDFEGKRVDIDAPFDKEENQYGTGRHLFNPTGFLDNTWFHRSYLMYGRTGGEGHGEYAVPPKLTPAGRMLAFDDSNVYGFTAAVYNNTMQARPYHLLYSAEKVESTDNVPVLEEGQKAKGQLNYNWQFERPALLANSMVVAGSTIFMAGPPEISDEEKAFGINFEEDSETIRSLAAQDRAWQGEQGAILQAVDKTSGKKLAEYKLPHIPVFDGMAAAKGALFIPLEDGSVVCFGK